MTTLRSLVPGLLLGLALAAPLPALAGGGDVAGQVTRQLVDQGYDRVEMHRTLLGKIVVTAIGRGHEREIVIDPRNGALLRDLVRDADGGTERVGLAVVDDNDSRSGSRSGSGSGSSGGGSSDDRGDDSGSDDSDSDDSDDSSDDDSDHDSDNDSGSNSGSGSGSNSGSDDDD